MPSVQFPTEWLGYAVLVPDHPETQAVVEADPHLHWVATPLAEKDLADEIWDALHKS